jgi:hypothetical protein
MMIWLPRARNLNGCMEDINLDESGNYCAPVTLSLTATRSNAKIASPINLDNFFKL